MRIIIILFVLLISCSKQTPPKHCIGDVVYLKPDSLKVVIYYIYDGKYAVRYTDKNGKIQETLLGDWGRHLLKETDIY